MSVVVIGMEEPECCPCELAGGYEIADPCFAGAGSPYMHKEFYQCVDDGTRPDWCPVRPLPDAHGDLIDRGQLAGRFVPRQAYFTDAIKEKIETAPTVIEAEGGSGHD